MRVSFSQEALDDAGAFRHLDRIIYDIEDGRHEWHIDDPDAIEQSRWFQGHRASLRVMLEKAAIRPTPRKPRRLHQTLLIVGADTPPGALSPGKAVQFLQTPLKILMENRNTDGAFLDAVLAVLADPETVRLKEELEALVYDSPGGNGELKKLVEDVHEKALWKGHPPRAVVFTDSDGPRAGQMSDQAKAVAETCQTLGMPCVVLRKRSIENYVPDEVIVEWGNEPKQTSARPRVAAILRLVGEQRDHFPMKTCLQNYKMKPEEIELYMSGTKYPKLSDEDAKVLQERGFGTYFVEIFFATNGDDEFERNAHGARLPRTSLTAEALRRRDGSGELDRLVAEIEERL